MKVRLGGSMDKQKKLFKKIYIEITNICNLSCPFCIPDNRTKEYMSIKNFKSVVEQIKTYTDYIYLHVKGEPLLHPQINECIQIAQENGLWVNITTNGTQIEKLTNKKIRQLNYSLQSSEDIQQIQQTIQKIRKFIEGTNIYVSLRLWSHKAKENKEILNMLQKEFDTNVMIQNKQIMAQNIFVSMEEEFIWPDLQNQEQGKKGYCHGLKDHIAILVDGTVVPCCLDHKGNMALGNIFKEKFATILQKEKTKEIIEGFKKREAIEELCQKCGFKNKF